MMWVRQSRLRRAYGVLILTAAFISGCGHGSSDNNVPVTTPPVTTTPPPVTTPPPTTTPPPVTPPPSTTTPSASFTSPASVQAGAPASFDASTSASATNSPLTYFWDFGDGTHGAVSQLARAYAAAGTYTVTLTVLDNAGHSASKAQSITVTAPPAVGPTVQVQGLVKDIANTPLAGVSATIVGSQATGTSDSKGLVTVSFPTAADVLVRLSKAGYADQFVPVHLPATSGADSYFEARLITREPAQTLADASQGGTLTGKNGAKVTLAGGTLIDASGQSVSGAVQVSITPVDVTSTAVGAFPGRFAGITPAAAITSLVSYGTVEYVLTQNGQRLQLAAGRTATIEIPSFPNANVDGTAVIAGSSVPLWTLDETTGYWTQEGVGTVVASTASPTGLALRATVGHFSWFNMDEPIADDYRPKPKCVDAGSGTPGSTDHLANATICNMLAQFQGANKGAPAGYGGGASAKASIMLTSPAAAPAVITPGYDAKFWVPIAGGVGVRLLPGYNFTLYASALNGTWLGQVTVSGAANDSPDVIVPMYPVQSAPATQNITLPFNQSLALGAGLITDLAFTTDGHLPVSISLVQGTASTFTGQARLLQGGTVLATASISNLVASLNSGTLAAGNYVIEVSNTGQQTGTFNLNARYVHWGTQGTAAAALQFGQPALLYDARGQAVLMYAQTYNSNPGVSGAPNNTRLVFQRLLSGAWTPAAATVELGTVPNAASNFLLEHCVGFALDHNGNPGYVSMSTSNQYTVNRWSGTAWQSVGPSGGALSSPVNTQGVCLRAPILRFAPNDQPLVAFDTYNSLFVQQFDGSAWQGLGGAANGHITLTTSQPLYGYAMQLDSTGAPVLEWNTGGTTSAGQVAYVLRYTTTPTPAWVGVGPSGGLLPPPVTSGMTLGFLYAPSLQLDASDRPLLAAGAYENSTQGWYLAAFKFDGSQWSASGFHTATPGGTVSTSTGWPIGLMQDSAGNLIIGWPETVATPGTGNTVTYSYQYFVQTWSGGASWQGLGSTLGTVDTIGTNYYIPNLVMVRDPAGEPAVVFRATLDNAGTNTNLILSVYTP